MRIKNIIYYPAFLVLGLLAESCQKTLPEEESLPARADSPLYQYSLNTAEPGVLKVKFRRGAPVIQSLAEGGVSAFSGVKSIDSVGIRLGNVSLRRLFSYVPRYAKRHQKYDLDLWYMVTFDKAMPMSRAVSDFVHADWVDIVEPVYKPERENGVATEIGMPAANRPLAGTMPFNDPRLPEQWHYDVGNLDSKVNIGVFKAWEVSTGSSDVIVAVTDYGVDYTHPDLAANMWVNSGEIPDDGIDNDRNGKVDDIHGYNFHGDNPQIDIGDHGTHVAGTIAALNGNGIGVCGIAGGGLGKGDGVRIMSCQIFPAVGFLPGVEGTEAEAIRYAADNGAVICQGSWGWRGGYFDEATRVAIDYFVDNAGCDENGNQVGPMKGGVAIFAMGNDRVEGDFFPACYEKCIAVSGLDFWGKKGKYSNYSEKADIAAPGGGGDQTMLSRDVLSTIPNGKYGTMYGTSMACPHVSGVAALVISTLGGPGFTPGMLTSRLLASCNSLRRIDGDYAPYLGVGFIRADRAVRKNDGAAPEKVSDFKLVKERNKYVLSWTIATDPGDDSPSLYNIYYSKSELTPANFREAQKITVDVSTEAPGKVYEYTVEGIDMKAYRYFLATGEDWWGNESAVSNVVVNPDAQVESSGELMIYPNPARKDLTVKWDGSFTGKKTIILYDLSAREVFRKEMPTPTGAGSDVLDLSALAAGKYILRLSAESRTETCNLIKL